jgi:hypothetical protein
MRSVRLALLALPAAAALSAQARPAAARAPMPVLQTATFDVAAAFQQHYRATIEPLVFGRFAIGISGEYTTEPDAPGYINYPVYDACPINRLCTNAVSGNDPSFRAWSFNLHARWYPAPLSFGNARQSAGIYLGEFIGYHERRISQTIYYGCPNCYPPPQPQDSTVVPPNPYPYPYPGPSSLVQVLHGWEPGVEFGVRLLPMHHVVMDIGGRFRLATIQGDYQARLQPGNVDSRLVVAVGVGW